MQLKEGRLQLCVGECNNGRQRVLKFSSLFSMTLLLRITAQLLFLKGGGSYNLLSFGTGRQFKMGIIVAPPGYAQAGPD